MIQLEHANDLSTTTLTAAAAYDDAHDGAREHQHCTRCLARLPVDRESPSLQLGYVYRAGIFGRVFCGLHGIDPEDFLCSSCHTKMGLS